MLIIYSILLAFIQALTEFLPVSSSGHLILVREFLGMDDIFFSLSFDIILHLGTLVALIVFFRKDILQIIKDIKKDKFKESLAFKILVATLPALFFGYFGGSLIENNLRESLIVSFNLILVGIIFIYAENVSKKEKLFNSFSFKDILIIGIAQALAIIPGVSRSGITIVAALLLGYRRADSAKFSFLLAIPATSIVSVKGVYDILRGNNGGADLSIYLVGFIFSSIFGFFVIKYFLQYLKKSTLKPFAYYRFALAIVFILLTVT